MSRKNNVRKLVGTFVENKPKMIFEILLKVGFRPGTLDSADCCGAEMRNAGQRGRLSFGDWGLPCLLRGNFGERSTIDFA